MLLAHAGADVTVYERLDHVGGRSATIEVPTDHGRYRFDRGPTFFLYPRVLEDIFASCGRRLSDTVELLRVDPQYRLIFADQGHLDACAEMARLKAEVARFSPADAESLPAFMAENRAKLAAFRPVLESAFDRITDYAAPAMLKALPKLRPHRSIDQDLARFFKDPRVRLAFTFQSKYLGMSPFRCPSLFTILAFMEYEYGVWHPRGGCGSVMTAMAEAARELGARIRLAEPVREILFEDRRVVGIRTEQGAQKLDALVINADFAQTMTKLVPDRLRRRWSNRRIARKKFSCSTFMLYLGVEGDIPQLAHHTIYLAKDYHRNVAEIEAGMVTPSEASMYIQNAGVTDAGLAPPGHSTLYVLVPVGNLRPGGVDWPVEQARFRRQTLDRLKQLGIPDIEQRIRFEKMVTPLSWRDDLQVFRGATFNLAHNMGQMLYFRPQNRFEDLKGVYLVGGGTHPGSGLPVIFESARITARLIAEDYRLARVPDSALEAPLPQAEPEAALS
jgi:phytoene desaturase